jgi:hypothetical protein
MLAFLSDVRRAIDVPTIILPAVSSFTIIFGWLALVANLAAFMSVAI